MRGLYKFVLLALVVGASAVPAPERMRFRRDNGASDGEEFSFTAHATTSVSVSTSVSTATSTSSAPSSSPTVPPASDDPNPVLFGTTSAERGPLGADVQGPNNIPIVLQNPDLLAPPTTDQGSIPNIKWPFSLSKNRIQTGGWARQQNVDVMPIATEIAGVDMRLEPGAYRELHWHTAAEWAYIIAGAARISTTTPEGQVYVADVFPGDLWYFPAGHPHSIQALGEEDTPIAVNGTEFLLIFDTGNFNEDDTFLLTDWLAHIPKNVLAKNFGQPLSAFDNIPGRQLYIFPGTPPPKDVADDEVVPNDTPEPFTFAASKVPAIQTPGGSYKIVDSTTFKVSKTIAMAEITVQPGGMRELHWHPTQPEWGFFLEGEARVTAFAADANAATYNFQAGDISYIPPGWGHYIENIGNTTLKFLEIFKTDKFQDISLQQWLALTPHDIVKAHLNLSDETIDKFNRTEIVVVAGSPSQT